MKLLTPLFWLKIWHHNILVHAQQELTYYQVLSFAYLASLTTASCFHPRDGSGVSRSKLQYNPRRRPDLSRQSHYQTPKRLPPHMRQQFQTWHHLPIYTVPRDGAINKSAMFTQPHRDYGRHFSIHPEWGLHKPLVLWSLDSSPYGPCWAYHYWFFITAVNIWYLHACILCYYKIQ